MSRSRPLIVFTDDDETLLGLIKHLLKVGTGAEVFATTDSQEALRRALADPPDLFITDLVKPGMDGLALIRALRADERTRGVLILVVSGNARKEVGLQATDIGADTVLSKPCRAVDLLTRVNRLLHRPHIDAVGLLIDRGVETPDLDFKEAPDLHTKDGCASLAKDVIGLANCGGGKVVFGVAEVASGRFRVVGCSRESLDQLEVTTLNKAIREYIDPSHHVSPRRIERSGLQLVVVDVPPADVVPLLARKQNDHVQLFPGRMYTRTSAAETAEARRPEEVRGILDRIVEARRTQTKRPRARKTRVLRRRPGGL